MERTAEGKTYPQWKQLIAERNTAIENARFWRRSFFTVAVAAFAGNGIIYANFMGWI